MATKSSSSAGALPVVDLAPFLLAGGDAADRARSTKAVREACMVTGFFHVVNHGVPRELMARALELSAVFFALPYEEKAKVRSAVELPGQVGYGQNRTGSAHKSEYLIAADPELSLNLYPTEPAGFRDALEECYAKLTKLALLVQDILNECMGLPRGFLADYNGDRSCDLLWSFRYMPANSTEDTSGSSAHEDPSVITFVLQDGVGGLEILGGDGWVPVEPIEGSIVVNIGDAIQVLSNKKFKSVTHRVVRSPVAHRQSLVFFFNLHDDKWVEPLPDFARHVGEAPRYRGFKYGDYVNLRQRKDVADITQYAAI